MKEAQQGRATTASGDRACPLGHHQTSRKPDSRRPAWWRMPHRARRSARPRPPGCSPHTAQDCRPVAASGCTARPVMSEYRWGGGLTGIQSIGHKGSLGVNAADQVHKYHSLPSCPGETAGIGWLMPAAVVGRPPGPGGGEPRPNTPSDGRLELGGRGLDDSAGGRRTPHYYRST